MKVKVEDLIKVLNYIDKHFEKGGNVNVEFSQTTGKIIFSGYKTNQDEVEISISRGDLNAFIKIKEERNL
jgi:hypothetical protein